MYIVDRIVARLSAELLAEAQRCLAQATRRVAGDGPAASYARCILIPEQHRCLGLFEASSADTVKRINDIAQVPFRWIAEASDGHRQAPKPPPPARSRRTDNLR